MAQQDNKPEAPEQEQGQGQPGASPSFHTIHLKSRDFQPTPSDIPELTQLARAGQERVHILVQLDFIPRQLAKENLQTRDLHLLAYVPDYAWIASVPATSPTNILKIPGVVWAGELMAVDKLDPAIQAGNWSAFNRSADGTVAVYVTMHKDESLETGETLVTALGGRVTGLVYGLNMMMAELPEPAVTELAASDEVQWIEPAAPPLDEANDGIRSQIGVDVVNSAPYDLDGTGIDVMVYDGGRADSHTDFDTRLVSGDTAAFSEHATHVAGILGGSGANSATQGGSTLQWQGMAPNVDLITYGIGSVSGMAFYEDPSDIETDWASAQNTFGADIGTASLSSNIYLNYPSRCDLMGKYGASAVLMDQIVRGGNSTVGIGDKYIATWAVGNERGWASSCGTYGIISPPAAAKNPIQVGGSNTNNNTQYAHTSWGPTEDGRIKPIVTAGGCQTTGDLGITSTDNFPADAYTVKCGTSMATPAVAGGLALMLQHYRDVYGTSGNFWPATAKAILIQTAVDYGNPGPDYQWGFGQVDIRAAVDLISRKAFRQDSINQGEVDLYYFIVGEYSNTAQVTLAWDDYEATLNANPALINNLDLELVSPSGVIWRPWILNPASPASNATRGPDSLNNQELVEVSSPEVGTWMVRVSGTAVPQGPQDYALVCEGCQPLDVGVCQAEVDGTAAASLASESDALGLANDGLGGTAVAETPTPLTTGEIWQRSLEVRAIDEETANLQTSLSLVADAREIGPEAVVALADTLRGPALDLAMDEITAAQALLSEAAPPQPETGPSSSMEEADALANQDTIDAVNRARALTPLQDPAEGQTNAPIAIQQPMLPATPAADLTVGNGCTYSTIAAAITAANPNDRLLIEGGVTFTENLVIDKNLTLSGGYNGCTSGSTARTIIDGGAAGRVLDIASGVNVTLQNLNLTNGNTGAEGGGIRFAVGGGAGTLTLTNVDVYANSAQWGGGIWIGPDAQLVGSTVGIYNNTASAYGGGVRLYGGRATLSDNSNVYNNIAPAGGGVYGAQASGFSPALNLPSSADVYDNQALTGSGLGGGVYLSQGTMTIADCSDIGSNDAIDGGGVYVITSTVTINGSCSEIQYNTATGNGGGVYAQGSTINLDDDAELYDNSAGTDGTGSGGGTYLDQSDLLSDKGSIRYNNTDDFGAGIYATNGSIVDMDLGSYSCLGERCSSLYGNIATSIYGGGMYVDDSIVWLDNIFVENNSANLGGAIYATNSSMYINNSLFARNNATSTAGDGIRLYTSATMAGSGNTFAYNDSGGISTGRAIDAFSSSLTLNCSIIWGHSSSITPSGEDVTYSDVQGGYTGAGNLDVNPLFIASGSFDYHLQNSSPVIDHCPSFSGLSTDFDNETRPIVRVTAATPYDMGADEVTEDRVGVNGACTYGTIQQAVNAASNGDTVQISAGVYFENVDITNKNITLAGGYDSTCTSVTGDPTRLEGSAGSSSTVDVINSTITIQNLDVAWGKSVGAGIDIRSSSAVTLDNADVFNNFGTSGGGVYVAAGSAITITNDADIKNNTASGSGGGALIYGQFFGNNTLADVTDNCASNGGGLALSGAELYLDDSDIFTNRAADAAGKGGGIYLISGSTATIAGNAWVNGNEAYDGGGIYADNATITLDGSSVTIPGNIATHYGGGIYLANNSTLISSGAHVGHNTLSSYGNQASYGAGLYSDNSTINFNGSIFNNVASSGGAGLYANGSSVNLTNTNVGGTGFYEANQVGASGHYGAGLYLTGATQAALNNTAVTSNIFQTTGFAYGGGAYVSSSSALTLTNNSRIQEHTAPSLTDGRGAGIYVNNGTVTIDSSQVISNTAGAVGGGIRMLGASTLNVTNGSVISHNESSSGEGGGIAASGAPDISLSGVMLQDNQAAGNGGAIYLVNGSLSAENCTFDQNSAALDGGAIYVSDSNLLLDRTYLHDNNGHLGGALYQTGSSSTGEATNSLLYGNTISGLTGAGIQVDGGAFTATHVTLANNVGPGYSIGGISTNWVYNSIAWGNSGGGFMGIFAGSDCSIDQSNNAGVNVDPQFVNPGVGEDYHVSGSSTAVDACATGLPIDLENNPRPKGGGYDMGAYELQETLLYLPVVLK